MNYADLAHAIRFLSADAVQQAKSGHPGMPMGMADIATVLFKNHLRFFVDQPEWHDRDRFVLSNGHGSMLLYSLLYLTGYEDMTIDEIKNFRQWGAKTAGHPEYGHAQGIETTTGPLGQGIANAVGMALAEARLNQRFGSDITDHYTYVFTGDGCLMEGISYEAASLAGHLGLKKLIVLFDDNDICIDGPVNMSCTEDHVKKFEAFGWDVQSIDGHDHAAIDAAISKAKQSDKPSFIACKTKIGWGSPNKVGTSATHGAPLGDDEIAAMRDALDWPYEPFEIPANILDSWRLIGQQRKAEYEASIQTLQKDPALQSEFLDLYYAHPEKKRFLSKTQNIIEDMVNQPEAMATRKASQKCLDLITEEYEYIVGGSADLTGSNNTKAKHMQPLTKENYLGNYIYYGIREHAMGAIMNGMSLHGGILPYSGTFLTFSDYCRPTMRLAALMGIKTIFVMTHDSIGLGEDGPTHQPIEHLASLRAIPNLNVYRPCDQIETMESWYAAMKGSKLSSPSVIVLSRQSMPQLRLSSDQAGMISQDGEIQGGYVLYDEWDTASTSSRKFVFYATGSETHLALEAAKEIEKQSNTKCRVISVPCMDLFSDEAREAVTEGADFHIAIEAAHSQSWYKYVGSNGMVIGIDRFGASAPAPKLFEEYGFTVEAILKKINTYFKKEKPHENCN